MKYPIFDSLEKAALFANTMWVNKIKDIAAKHNNTIILGTDKNNVKNLDELTNEQIINDVFIFYYKNNQRVYDKGLTKKIVDYKERYDLPNNYFINIDVVSRCSNLLDNCVCDAYVDEIPESWYPPPEEA